MYKRIKQQKQVLEKYADKLIQEGSVSKEWYDVSIICLYSCQLK